MPFRHVLLVFVREDSCPPPRPDERAQRVEDIREAEGENRHHGQHNLVWRGEETAEALRGERRAERGAQLADCVAEGVGTRHVQTRHAKRNPDERGRHNPDEDGAWHLLHNQDDHEDEAEERHKCTGTREGGQCGRYATAIGHDGCNAVLERSRGTAEGGAINARDARRFRRKLQETGILQPDIRDEDPNPAPDCVLHHLWNRRDDELPNLRDRNQDIDHPAQEHEREGLLPGEAERRDHGVREERV